MRYPIILLLLGLIAAVAPIGAAAQAAEHAVVDIEVRRLAAGEWQVRYSPGEPVTRLRFQRRRWAFRHEGWRVVTPGVRLVAADGEERLEADDGRPLAEVVLRFEGDTRKREREYVLTPRLGDGSEAIFTGLLYVDAVRDGVALRTASTLRFVPMAGESVVLGGERTAGPTAWSDPTGRGTYVYFGGLAPVATERVLAMIDPGLPDHLTRQLHGALPALFDLYAESLGHATHRRPFVLATYEPGQQGQLSVSGDVLPGVIRLGFSGGGWALDSPDVRERAFGLLAHEVAHLWNGDRFESAANQEEPWLHEGSAEAFAWLAMRRLGIIDDDGVRRRLEASLNHCLRVTRGRPFAAAMAAGQAPYTCGAATSLLVELELAERGGLFGVWRAVFDAAAAADDRYTAAQYFGALEHLAGDVRLSGLLQRLLTEPVPDGAALLAAELRAHGVAAALGGEMSDAAATEALRDVLAAAMEQDCAGRYSVSIGDGGLRLHGVAGCGTLPERVLNVERVAGTSTDRAAAAYGALVRTCAADGWFSLAEPGPAAVLRLRCPGTIPDHVSLAGWPAARTATP